ncbi:MULTISPECIES: helix-turn-helix domain-containing protein [Endozoicomonas]|uniref:Helix-turn-helix domain-containing protein n=2 Tax=Endozoicomonas TaxID=305899 RepID=A0ABY6GRC1_9GAMM|nr:MULTISPECIES: helix-turn-helix transcriptional regulator [Endozoicomonas]MCW7553874.1 helix-turn-helix domain-containing protein [Endozoicomonas gorgoniicola]UYM14596.1 helix-turn-helix domain-containing protein [Endozoicomonas euniceicola]
MDPKQQFGRKLKELRKQQGLSQEELAHRAGLHNPDISEIEHGQRNPTLMTMHRLAQALDVEIKIFFE